MPVLGTPYWLPLGLAGAVVGVAANLAGAGLTHAVAAERSPGAIGRGSGDDDVGLLHRCSGGAVVLRPGGRPHRWLSRVVGRLCRHAAAARPRRTCRVQVALPVGPTRPGPGSLTDAAGAVAFADTWESSPPTWLTASVPESQPAKLVPQHQSVGAGDVDQQSQRLARCGRGCPARGGAGSARSRCRAGSPAPTAAEPLRRGRSDRRRRRCCHRRARRRRRGPDGAPARRRTPGRPRRGSRPGEAEQQVEVEPPQPRVVRQVRADRAERDARRRARRGRRRRRRGRPCAGSSSCVPGRCRCRAPPVPRSRTQRSSSRSEAPRPAAGSCAAPSSRPGMGVHELGEGIVVSLAVADGGVAASRW